MKKLYFKADVYVRQLSACNYVIGTERYGVSNEMSGYISIADTARDLVPLVDNMSLCAVKQMILLNCTCLETQ